MNAHSPVMRFTIFSAGKTARRREKYLNYEQNTICFSQKGFSFSSQSLPFNMVLLRAGT